MGEEHIVGEIIFDTLAKEIFNCKGINPLFIYGGSGLGKTYILHVIEREIKAKAPEKKVIYITAERFTGELVDALGRNKRNAFKSKFRGADVLIMDDIQFLRGKDVIQEEFFHTFNDLIEENKQVVFACDRNPMEIENLSDKVANRICSGLVIELSMAPFTRRKAKLKYVKE